MNDRLPYVPFMITLAGFTATFICPGAHNEKNLEGGFPPRRHTHECGDMAFFRAHIPTTIEYTYMQVRCICLSCIVSPSHRHPALTTLARQLVNYPLSPFFLFHTFYLLLSLSSYISPWCRIPFSPSCSLHNILCDTNGSLTNNV